MGTADQELEKQLIAAGNALLPPPSVDQLLPLLDNLGCCLARMNQSLSNSTQQALDPATKALTAKELFSHLDVDVKVSVALCLNEIMRIRAPDVLFDDEQLKGIFQLTVSAFENLSDTSSKSYDKRVSILKTVAKVRTFLLMMDLECDSLILDMFKHFLGNIRDNHPDDVYSSMGLIMILVLREIEKIPPELLSVLLDSVRKGNKDVLPIARKLGGRVIENCTSKLKPYIHQAVTSMGFPSDSYGELVAHLCEQQSQSVECSSPASQDNASGKRTSCPQMISKRSGPKLRRVRKRKRGRKPKRDVPSSPSTSIESHDVCNDESSLPPSCPSTSIERHDVSNDEHLLPKGGLLEHLSNGTRIPKGKRSSPSVDAKNNESKKISALRAAALNGADVTNESGGKQRQEICMKLGAGGNTKDKSPLIQWRCRKRRGFNSKAIVLSI